MGLLAAPTACSSSTGDTPNPDGGAAAPTFTEVYTSVIAASSCVGCHNATVNAGNLDMSTQALAYMNLVGKAASGPLCASSGEERVVISQPSQSLLVSKISATTPLCGAEMPQGGPFLSATQVALVTDWIAAGAPND